MPTLAVRESSRWIVSSPQLAEHIQRDEPLNRYTSLGIGGPADFFARPRTLSEVQDSLAFAEEHALGLFTQDQMEDAFRGARLTVRRLPDALRTRGLYVGKRPAD